MKKHFLCVLLTFVRTYYNYIIITSYMFNRTKGEVIILYIPSLFFTDHRKTHFHVRIEIEVLRIAHKIFSYYAVMNERWAVRIFKGKVRYRHYFLRYVGSVRKTGAMLTLLNDYLLRWSCARFLLIFMCHEVQKIRRPEWW